MFLLANGVHFGLTNSVSYNIWYEKSVRTVTGYEKQARDSGFSAKPEPGIMLGYRWLFGKSLWFLDWNFLDIPYQRAFRVGRLFYGRKYALYGVVNPMALMIPFSKKDQNYNLGDAFFQKLPFSAGVCLGIGNAYSVSKNITISLEYIMQTDIEARLRHQFILGVEFHKAAHND